MADDKEQLWHEIIQLTSKSARIRAQRDVSWYLRAIEFVRSAEDKLLEGLIDAITKWQMANGLDESSNRTGG